MDNRLSERISIVLVASTHPGNIGATARAMKTMGLTRLRLVAPRCFPSAAASARAAGADDILAAAQCHATLEEALADCTLVFATSARARRIAWPTCSPEAAARSACACAQQGGRVAMVFGRERSGLSNQELECCHAMLQIPSNPAFSSLNLAAAVQIVAYELHKMLCGSADEAADKENAQATPAVSGRQMAMLYAHLEATLLDIDYLDAANPRQLMRRLKRLFNRARLDANEYNILRGILAATQAKAKAKAKR